LNSTVPNGGGVPTPTVPEPSDLDTAIRVAQRMLADYGNTSGYDIYAYAQAHGGLTEALRILLRALDSEPDVEKLPDSGKLSPRCPAAHPEDPTPCTGPPTVTVLDAKNAGADGCQHHAARMLASLDGGRVYGLPHATPGTAIRVFKAAAGIRPFPWVEGLRTRDEQLSRDEVRARGEQQ
jgi:hypothetical protein